MVQRTAMEQYLWSPLSDPVTSVFFDCLIVVFLSALVVRVIKIRRDLSTLERYAPNTLVTIGVIGSNKANCCKA